jgi:ATP-dependent 26S proteasome regulatory subunit
MSSGTDEERQHALASFKTKLLESREWEAKLKALRLEIKGLQKDFDHTEDNIKALQSVGQIIGEVLKQLDDERCKCFFAYFHFNFVDFKSSSYRQSLIWSSICCRL